MRALMYARINRTGSYDEEVAPMAFLMVNNYGEYYINVISRNDLLIQQVHLRAWRIEDAYGDFRQFVMTNGGVDFSAASEEHREVAEREAYYTRH